MSLIIPFKKNAVRIAASVIFVGLSIWLLSKPGSPRITPGSAAPAFSMTDLGGRTVSLSDFSGKVVLLDFWATWCSTCDADVPKLKTIYGSFSRSDFEIIAASVDEGGPELVARYAAERSLPYPVVFAGEKTARDYQIFGLPTKFLIDSQGKIFKKYVSETDHDSVKADIETLLARRQP